MGGALLQLVAYGSQDVYLIGNPQITLFKSVQAFKEKLFKTTIFA